MKKIILFFLVLINTVSFCYAEALTRKDVIKRKINTIRQRELEINREVQAIMDAYNAGKLNQEQVKERVMPLLRESQELVKQIVKIMIANVDVLADDLKSSDASLAGLSNKDLKARLKSLYRQISQSGVTQKALQELLKSKSLR